MAETIPTELIALKQWILHDKTKRPLSAKGGAASSTDSNTWVTYNQAREALTLSKNRDKGIGFVFSKDDPYIGIDLDDCFKGDAPSSGLKDWAYKVVMLFNSYTEISPSGTGLHIIIKGNKHGLKCKKNLGERGAVEMYSSARYFTMTGNLYSPEFSKIESKQKEFNTLYKQAFGLPNEVPLETEVVQITPANPIDTSEYSWRENKKPLQTKKLEGEKLHSAAGENSGVNGHKNETTDSILERIRKSKQAGKFHNLTSGDWAEHDNDHSRAVFSLLNIVAFYTPSFTIADQIFTQSALNSEKWDTGSKYSKWNRLGHSEFSKVRSELESKGEVFQRSGEFNPPAQDAAQDFSDEVSESATEEEKEECKKGKLERDIGRYVELSRALFSELRRDLFTDVLHGKVKETGRWEPVLNRRSVQAMRAIAQSKKGKFKPGEVEPALLYTEAKSKPGLLIDVPEWDGEDRIAFMCSLLDLTEESMTTGIFTDLFKDWCARMWQKVENPLVQNRCIIFIGNQGIGKDVWVQSMFGALGHYLSDLAIDRFTRDSDISVVLGSNLVCFISEFDTTHAMSPAKLKDIITKPSFTVVRKYDRDATRLENRCSLIGACNIQEVMRDVTGNRRFLAFKLRGAPGQAIKWEYPVHDKAFSMQIIAQCKALAAEDYHSSKASEAVIKEITRQYTPENPHDELVEEFESELDALAEGIAFVNDGMYRVSEIESILVQLGRNYGHPRRTVLQVLKNSGCQHRTGKTRFYKKRDTNPHWVEKDESDEETPF